MTAWLFVPGSRPDRFDKALGAGAAEVIVDLEDAVAPDAKAEARSAVVDWLGHAEAWVRVNAAGTPWHEDDLAALVATRGLRGVVLPKAEDPDDVRRAAALLDGRGLVPLVESALGVARVHEVAQVPGVTRLAFGPVDYALDLGAEEEPETLAHPRAMLVLASRVARLAPAIDGPSVAVRDLDPVVVDADRARRLGFGAKLCIHPAQVDVVQRAFAPTTEQVDWARGLVAAAAEHPEGAAFAHEGRMVDVPVVTRARTLLERAEQR